MADQDPDSAAGTPSGHTVPMLSPDGTPGDVPAEHVSDAVGQGFKIGMDMIAYTKQWAMASRSRRRLARRKLPALM